MRNKVVFTSFNNDSNWVRGNVGSGHVFTAKLYNEGSEYGIGGGRVSKLEILDVELDENIVIYDRDWVLEPETEEQIEVFKSVITFLEESPQRDFD